MNHDFDDCPNVTNSAPKLINVFEIALDSALISSEEVDTRGLKSSIEPFQEAPQLIDGVIESAIARISKAYLRKTKKWHVDVLSAFVKVRGAKIVGRFFPNDVGLITRVLDDLEQNDKEEEWQCRHVLLIWMTVLVLTPFKFDNIELDLSERIYQVCKKHIGASGKERDAATSVLARFLARVDTVHKYLPRFLDDVAREGMSTAFTTLGIASTIADFLSFSSPSDVTEYIPQLQSLLGLLKSSGRASSHSYLRKLLCKATYRLALSSLATSPEEIPQCVESCLDELLTTTIADKDTIVRYSASKAIARIALGLAKIDTDGTLVSQIVESVFGIFDDASHDRMHGGLLSVGELERRRVLTIPKYSAEVQKVVTEGLRYEVRKATFSIGADVRDAACYAAWSLFKHYPTLCEQSPQLVRSLLSELVLVGCFDREINNRRAAAAAIQECIGRYSSAIDSLETGIALVQAFDYFGIGNRQHAFLEVSLAVQKLKVCDRMVETALHAITSWDAEIRRLAAKSLALLCSAEGCVLQVINSILLKVHTNSLEEQHGYLCALGELLDVVTANTIQVSKLDIFKKTQFPAHEARLRYEGALRFILSAAKLFSLKRLSMPATFGVILENALSMPDDGGELYSAAAAAAKYFSLDANTCIKWARANRPGYAVVLGVIGSSSDVAKIGDLVNANDVAVRVAAIHALQDITTREGVGRVEIAGEAVYKGLQDYTVMPTKGDAGSLVRAASIEFVQEYSSLFHHETVVQLVRISMEKIDKLRNAAVAALRKLVDGCGSYPFQIYNVVTNEPVSFTYLVRIMGCADAELRQAAVLGICGSIGGSASESVVRAAVEAICRYILLNDGEESTQELRLFADTMSECLIHPPAAHPRREFETAELIALAIENGLELTSYVPVYNKLAKMCTFALKKKNSRQIAACISVFGALCSDSNASAKVREASMKKLCEVLVCNQLQVGGSCQMFTTCINHI
ncbi:armadillo-type protein [Lipomyces arxii]|uniref:armadillo-type protein n=1 Tax=Lipomyces arxii TaxID=56418 RepID=UPI0034CD2D80